MLNHVEKVYKQVQIVGGWSTNSVNKMACIHSIYSLIIKCCPILYPWEILYMNFHLNQFYWLMCDGSWTHWPPGTGGYWALERWMLQIENCLSHKNMPDFKNLHLKKLIMFKWEMIIFYVNMLIIKLILFLSFF
jgi:hypothetical protein